jgi:hypothetical protein
VMVNNDDSELCDHAMGGTDKQIWNSERQSNPRNLEIN